MKKNFHDIKTTPLVIVTTDCPLNVYRIKGYLGQDRKYDNCTKCDFFLKENQCGYQLYETRLIEYNSITDDDDCSFALPDTDYTWDFKCAKCGNTIRFTSGFSVLVSGDQKECSVCKTKHRYIKNSNGIYFFAIPISEEA